MEALSLCLSRKGSKRIITTNIIMTDAYRICYKFYIAVYKPYMCNPAQSNAHYVRYNVHHTLLGCIILHIHIGTIISG